MTSSASSSRFSRKEAASIRAAERLDAQGSSGPEGERVEVMPVSEHERLREAAQAVMDDAKRERHNLSSVHDDALATLRSALEGKP
jgi:hypothetical protein